MTRCALTSEEHQFHFMHDGPSPPRFTVNKVNKEGSRWAGNWILGRGKDQCSDLLGFETVRTGKTALICIFVFFVFICRQQVFTALISSTWLRKEALNIYIVHLWKQIDHFTGTFPEVLFFFFFMYISGVGMIQAQMFRSPGHFKDKHESLSRFMTASSQ